MVSKSQVRDVGKIKDDVTELHSVIVGAHSFVGRQPVIYVVIVGAGANGGIAWAKRAGAHDGLGLQGCHFVVAGWITLLLRSSRLGTRGRTVPPPKLYEVYYWKVVANPFVSGPSLEL